MNTTLRMSKSQQSPISKSRKKQNNLWKEKRDARATTCLVAARLSADNLYGSSATVLVLNLFATSALSTSSMSAMLVSRSSIIIPMFD